MNKLSEIIKKLKETLSETGRLFSIIKQVKNEAEDDLSNVLKGNIVITSDSNSVVIRYSPGEDFMPVVVMISKNKKVSNKIIEIAKSNNMLIINDEKTTKLIKEKCRVGEFVPEESLGKIAGYISRL